MHKRPPWEKSGPQKYFGCLLFPPSAFLLQFPISHTQSKPEGLVLSLVVEIRKAQLGRSMKEPCWNGIVRMMEWALLEVPDSLTFALPLPNPALPQPPRLPLPASDTQQSCSTKQLPNRVVHPGPHGFSLTQVISWPMIHKLRGATITFLQSIWKRIIREIT